MFLFWFLPPLPLISLDPRFSRSVGRCWPSPSLSPFFLLVVAPRPQGAAVKKRVGKSFSADSKVSKLVRCFFGAGTPLLDVLHSLSPFFGRFFSSVQIFGNNTIQTRERKASSRNKQHSLHASGGWVIFIMRSPTSCKLGDIVNRVEMFEGAFLLNASLKVFAGGRSDAVCCWTQHLLTRSREEVYYFAAEK